MEESDAKSLGRFLADNDDLEKLSARLATFNVFRALKVEYAEIRHSNTLAWLLDPGESHGLGDLFLRRILSNMLLDGSAHIKGFSAAQVELMDLRDAEVRREWKHIDVFIIDRRNNLVLLIENKIGSGEGGGQLVRYRKVIDQEFPNFRLVPVFLTLDGKPSDDEDARDYISYSHARLVGVLERILDQRQEQMPLPILTFLTHYTDTLRRLTMQDKELVDLCQRIYRKHKEAIKLIVNYGEVSSFSQLAQEIVGKNEDCEVLRVYPKQIWLIPKSWAKVVPENSSVWTHLGRPFSVVCWMELWNKKISLKFEVSGMEDSALRMACVTALSEKGYKFGKHAFKEEAVFSRFFRLSHELGESEDEAAMRQAIEKLFGTAREHFPKVEEILKQVFAGKA